jgi:transposase InsO family protein
MDGHYRAIVHVRDLASRYYLAAMPVARATARTVCDVIRHVTAQGTPPLVLKVDNGSPFGSGLLQRWAQRTGTLLLYSPPAYPAYNGSIEASIGALTARTHEGAALHGHPEDWTTEDLEAARVAANLTPMPSGSSEAPATRWRRAMPATRAERRRFLARYGRDLAAVSAAAGLSPQLATLPDGHCANTGSLGVCFDTTEG